ncbi:MAG: hypothetical protein Q4G07_06920 [Oscillospiraceae bacterium]|nr:hypothetical protein [Oscillospiraceae bacterium]
MVTIEVDFESCYKDTREILRLEETHILNNEGNIPVLMSGIEFDRKTLAMPDFLYYSNIMESRKNFYRAALAREWIYNEFEKRNTPLSAKR